MPVSSFELAAAALGAAVLAAVLGARLLRAVEPLSGDVAMTSILGRNTDSWLRATSGRIVAIRPIMAASQTLHEIPGFWPFRPPPEGHAFHPDALHFMLML